MTRLYDGIEQLEDELDDGASVGDHSGSDEEYANDNMDVDVDGVRRDDLHIYDTIEQDGTLIWARQVSEFRTHETILIPNIQAEYMEGLGTGQSMRDESYSPLDESEVSTMLECQDDDTVWKRFEISSIAPPDHAFFSSSPGQPSKPFLGRLRREYHILATSLPGKYFL